MLSFAMGFLNIDRFKRRLQTQPESFRDWPQDLRVSAEAAKLAPLLFAACCAVQHNRYDAGEWDAQPLAVRRPYLQSAALAIRQNLKRL